MLNATLHNAASHNLRKKTWQLWNEWSLVGCTGHGAQGGNTWLTKRCLWSINWGSLTHNVSGDEAGQDCLLDGLTNCWATRNSLGPVGRQQTKSLLFANAHKVRCYWLWHDNNPEKPGTAKNLTLGQVYSEGDVTWPKPETDVGDKIV